MVSLNRINSIDLVETSILGNVSCIKYNNYLYSVVGQQEAGIPNAGTNYLFKTDPNTLETLSNELPNYYALPDPSWLPDPLPPGYNLWGFINLQEVVLITSNDDGTFWLTCPDCYVQAQDTTDTLPAVDISFPATIYMDENLNIDYDLSVFYTEGTVLPTNKKESDNIGDVIYSIDYDLFGNSEAFLKSEDEEERAISSIGTYEVEGYYDLNCLESFCFVITYDTGLFSSNGVYLYNIYVYLEEPISGGIITTPPRIAKRRRSSRPRGTNKAKEFRWRFGTTFNSVLKKSKLVKGKEKYRPYR